MHDGVMHVYAIAIGFYHVCTGGYKLETHAIPFTGNGRLIANPSRRIRNDTTKADYSGWAERQ